jgi:hypothetical protein
MTSISSIIKKKEKKRHISLPNTELKDDFDSQLPEALVQTPLTDEFKLLHDILKKEMSRQPSNLGNDSQNDLDEEEDEEDEEDQKDQKWKHVMFISDVKLTKTIRKQLDSYSNIKEFDVDTFKNRDCTDLSTKRGVEHIWICLKDAEARKWVSENLKSCEPYSPVCCYRTKNSKWVYDIKDYCNVTCKISDIKNLKSLCFKDFQDSLEKLGIDIHIPANRILSCIGLSNKVKKNR